MPIYFVWILVAVGSPPVFISHFLATEHPSVFTHSGYILSETRLDSA